MVSIGRSVWKKFTPVLWETKTNFHFTVMEFRATSGVASVMFGRSVNIFVSCIKILRHKKEKLASRHNSDRELSVRRVRSILSLVSRENLDAVHTRRKEI